MEHASLADDEAIALAKERNVAFSMDLYFGDYVATAGVEQGWPDEFVAKSNEVSEAKRRAFTSAYEAGVALIFGTDAGVYPHGDNAKQFAVMVQQGMSPMDAIKAATSLAANHLGWADDVGSLLPGRFGDLIAVDGNPVVDISALEKVDVVIKGGLLFKHQGAMHDEGQESPNLL